MNFLLNSYDGKLFILYAKRRIYLLDWALNKVLFEFDYPGGNIYSIKFDPNSNSRLSVSGRGFIKLWKCKTGNAGLVPLPDIVGLNLKGQEIHTHVWNANQGLIHAISTEGNVFIIDPAHQVQHFIEKPHNGYPIYDLAILEEDLFVTTGADGTVTVYKEPDESQDDK